MCRPDGINVFRVLSAWEYIYILNIMSIRSVCINIYNMCVSTEEMNSFNI
jgi:hypothetical protein